jgi:hypothetical protein
MKSGQEYELWIWSDGVRSGLELFYLYGLYPKTFNCYGIAHMCADDYFAYIVSTLLY